jgi:ATPase subunit of ABC transporter with duplicated ATPase domains
MSFNQSETMNHFVQMQNLKYDLPNGDILLEKVDLSIQRGDKIALIGPNGSGKSTLMKIIAGDTRPSEGDVQISGIVSYVPQLDLNLSQNELPLYEYIALFNEDWWEVTTILETTFGWVPENVAQKVRTLSGGELVKVNLAIALSRHPDILLLDEPTNHLDIQALEILRQFLQNYTGAFVLISHNPFFIDMTVDQVWEIDQHTINRYGGNYSDYRNQKEANLEAQSRQRSAAKQELKNLRRARERELQRAARSRRTGREVKHDRSMSTIEKGFFANKASKSAGKRQDDLSEKEDEIHKRLSSLKQRRNRKAHLDLQAESEGRRHLTTIINGEVSIEERKLIDNVNMDIKYGDRIVVTGPNGSGKSTLAKSIGGIDIEGSLTGDIRTSETLRAVYLSQKYEIVNPDLTLVENMVAANPNISYQEIRRILGNFLFLRDEDINKKASVLSGGETARLAFSMITASPVDLLILDEPTNNLDIDTVDSITEALTEFPGAVVVISHDIDFLDNLEVNEAYTIKSKRLVRMSSLPEQREEFYNELLNNDEKEQ